MLRAGGRFAALSSSEWNELWTTLMLNYWQEKIETKTMKMKMWTNESNKGNIILIRNNMRRASNPQRVLTFAHVLKWGFGGKELWNICFWCQTQRLCFMAFVQQSDIYLPFKQKPNASYLMTEYYSIMVLKQLNQPSFTVWSLLFSGGNGSKFGISQLICKSGQPFSSYVYRPAITCTRKR